MVTPEQVNAANRALYWINLFKPWALAFVAIGVPYEFVADRLERPYAKLLDTAHDEELAQFRISGDALRRDMAASIAREKEANARIAEAQRGAVEANAKAEGFRLDIAKANESAAKAQAQVAGAMAEAAKANLELAKLKTPRTLSSEQQARLIAALTQFAGTPFDLVVYSDSESVDLMKIIQSVLSLAKWKQVAAKGVIGIGGSVPLVGITLDTGILVQISTASVNWYRVAEKLVALLRGEKLDARGEAAMTGVDTDAIHIVIGKKP